MALTDQTLSLIAFKNLQGKSHTDNNKGVGNEAEGIFLNVSSSSIFMDEIDSDPAIATTSGIVELVLNADLTEDPTSNGHVYFATYPIGHPKVGERIRNAVSPAYGFQYEVVIRDNGSNIIPVNDPRDWIFQYNSGVFYQQDVVGNDPQTLDIYVYIGETLDQVDLGSTYTFINGIEEITTNNIGLGGTLTQNTSIDADSNTLDITNLNGYSLTTNSGGEFSYNSTSGNISLLDITGGGLTTDTFNAGIILKNAAMDNIELDSNNSSIILTSSAGPSININGANTSGNTGGIVVTTTSKGIEYYTDYSATYTNRSLVDKEYVDTQITENKAFISPDDKNMNANNTSSDGDLASNDTLTNTPIDGSYVAVFVNGQEFDCGNGVKTNSCYFSGDGGTSARGFLSTHPNGQVQSGDSLYWNGSIAGTELSSLWRISLIYLV